MAEYGSMFAVSGLATILFCGGWNGPIPVVDVLKSTFGITHESAPFLNYAGNFIGMLNFILKSSLFVIVMIWVRWTLPRLRIDQVMKMCLKYCVPIAAVMFLGATLWTYSFPGGVVLPVTYGNYYSEPKTAAPAVHVEKPHAADPHAKTASLDSHVVKGS